MNTHKDKGEEKKEFETYCERCGKLMTFDRYDSPLGHWYAHCQKCGWGFVTE